MLGKLMVISYYYTQIMWSLEFEDDNFNRKPYTNVYICLNTPTMMFQIDLWKPLYYSSKLIEY